MAYCCSQTLTSVSTSCDSQMGGIRIVYGIARSQVAGYTIDNGVVTAITTVDNAKFHTYAFRKQSSTMSSTYTIDDTNGVKYVTTELVLNFAKQESAKRVSLTALINCESVLVVEDNNGAMWLLGYDNPVSVSGAEAQSGTAFGDPNQYSVTLQDMSAEFPMQLNIGDFVENQTTEA